jgi:hypothetical protein
LAGVNADLKVRTTRAGHQIDFFRSLQSPNLFRDWTERLKACSTRDTSIELFQVWSRFFRFAEKRRAVTGAPEQQQHFFD